MSGFTSQPMNHISSPVSAIVQEVTFTSNNSPVPPPEQTISRVSSTLQRTPQPATGPSSLLAIAISGWVTAAVLFLVTGMFVCVMTTAYCCKRRRLRQTFDIVLQNVHCDDNQAYDVLQSKLSHTSSPNMDTELEGSYIDIPSSPPQSTEQQFLQ